MATTKDEILDAIASMTVLELSELLKDFEEKFGVTAAAPVAVAAAAGAGGGGRGRGRGGEGRVRRRPHRRRRQEDRGHQGGPRSLTSLGLKEAKDLVDAAPKPCSRRSPRRTPRRPRPRSRRPAPPSSSSSARRPSRGGTAAVRER